MPIPTIIIDVYSSVWSVSLNRCLLAGEINIEISESEAGRWVGKYALLSSERIEQERIEEKKRADKSRATKASRIHRNAVKDKHARADNDDVGR